jgi:hypothetical protein
MWSFPPTLTIWPGFALDGTIDGASDALDAGADAAAVFDAGGAAEGAAPPHAPTASATIEARDAIRMNLLLPIWLLSYPLGWCNPWLLKRSSVARDPAPLLSLSSSLSAALHLIA